MRYALGLGLLLLLSCRQAVAQDEPLTVAQAVELALQYHPSLKASGFELQAAQAQLKGAGALTSPEVRVTPGIGGPESVDERVEVAQPLEINGARRARTQVARGLLAETSAGAALTRLDLVRQVKQAYWETALAQQLVGLDRENVKYALDLAQAAQTEFELGDQPQVQVIKAEVETARARQELFRSEAAVEQAKARLNTLLGRAPEAPLSLAEDPSAVALDFDPAGLIELGLKQRPDVLQAQAAVATTRGEVAVARAARRTDVAVVGRLTPDGGGGVGLSLNFPQLDWGSLRAEQKRAEALVLAREQQLDVVRNNVRLEIANALTAVRLAQAQANEYREQVVAQSRKLADLALLGYQEGASTFLDVLDARRTLRAVNVEYYSAVAEQQKSLAELEFVAGGSLPAATAEPGQPAEVK